MAQATKDQLESLKKTRSEISSANDFLAKRGLFAKANLVLREIDLMSNFYSSLGGLLLLAQNNEALQKAVEILDKAISFYAESPIE